MDPLGIIVQAIATVILGFGVGGVMIYFYRDNAKEAAFEIANDYLAEFAKDVQEDPEKYAELLKPLFGMAARGFLRSGKGEKAEYIKIGPIKLPYQVIEPFIAKFADGMTKKAPGALTDAAYSLLDQ